MSAVKRKLNNTKLIKKCQIIREVEKGMTNKEASEKYGVPKNTISTWMKNKEKLLQGLEQSSSEAKKMRGHYNSLKALISFKASDGWLDKWRKRHNISLKTIGGEPKSVAPHMSSSWNETTLPTILSNYKLEDIFNADEFGLFYQCLPDKTYHFKGEKCSEGKKSKVRFTGMAAASAKGEQLPMFAIGNEIFEEWLRKVDRKFRVDGRKIALIIDNCRAHPTLSNLTNVQLVFLPPNTTSILQPMDQGVIRSLKAYYRGKVVRMISRALEEKKSCPKISILQGMKLLADSWELASKETIVNCFRKAGITPDGQQAAIDDSDDPFKDLQESLNNLRKADSSMVPNDVTATALASLDDDVIATAPEMNEDDIVSRLKNQENEEEESGDEEIQGGEMFDPVAEKPSRSALESALEILKDAAMFSDKSGQIKRVIFDFERLYESDRAESLKQKDITHFLNPVSN
ncbi:tigger transposable element-derived protein 4-like [Penaeus monodon]|uniref:tigger transposable element-derived protein 4-like n=1 Tax=Penaeus monodon TaxID=6687 RepID=UPI0018A6E8BD|nr:tigger transposable element-derived protein 4-like [Penaeus monodon]